MRVRLLVSSFASCGVAFVAAQPNPAPKADERAESLPAVFVPRPPPSAARPAGAPPPASPAPSPRRAISPEMSANLAALAARAPVASATPTAGATSASPGDTTDVLLLKPYVVRETKLPRFKERELMTPKAKLEMARKRYPGLGPFGDAYAVMRLEQDLRLEELRELQDLSRLLDTRDAQSLDAKRLINDAKHAEKYHQQFGRLPR
jgi:hypothetical protein